MPLRLAMSVGRPMTSSAPYWYPCGALLSVTVTSRLSPGASVNALSLTATLDRVERRFGLACPEELCVHGRALTATVSALVELFETFSVFVAPGAAWRSTDPFATARPPESAAAPAFVPSACAITAPAVTRAAAAAAPPNTIIRTSSDPRSLALDHQTYHANVRLGPDW